MKKRINLELWPRLIVSVFFIMLIALSIMFSVTIVIYRLPFFSAMLTRHIYPFIVLFLLSIVVSYFFTSMLSNRILMPIELLIRATKQVSKGDFRVHLDENFNEHTIREMNVHFNGMIRELNSIETFRNDFIVNVSHEFKTPITAIEGYATLLQDKSLSEAEHEEYTHMIIESARQLSVLSTNILKLSKLENQEILVEKTCYQLDEQLRQAILLLEVNWSKKNLQLDIDLDSVDYYGNEELLFQVWLNILGNAVKFTPQDGSVSVSMHRMGQEIVVEIADTGIGMTKDVTRHIYDKFYQGDKARNMEGNGLGLTLVKRIVDLCGGGIEVRSIPGKGTTFVVRLPL